MGQNMVSLHLWLILAAGCLGVVMGINRTIKTSEHESRALQNLSAIAGVLLIVASIYTIVTSGGLTVRTSYTILLMLILGLSLSARQLGSIPIVAVVILILGLGGLYVFGHTDMPHNFHELLRMRSPKIMIISVVIVICGFVVLAMTTVEMLVHMVLNVLGQGIVVIVLSAISMIHAGLILFTGDGRGLLKFM
jgi:hypothetical protein